MSSGHDDRDQPSTPPPVVSDDADLESFEEESDPGLLSSVWFRAVLVLVVVGIVAIISVPYVMDWMTAPELRTATAPVPPAPPKVVASPAVPEATSPAPAPPAAAAPSPAPAPAPSPAVTTPPPPPAQAVAPPPVVAPPPRPAPPAQKSAATPTPPAPKSQPSASDRPADTALADAKPQEAKATPKGAPGTYWVQVGAYKDPETAKRVATRLREQQFRVEESVTQTGLAGAPPAAAAAPAPAPASTDADRYDVLVTGASPAEVTAKLAGKGVAVQAAPTGALITPSLPLRDAVALSKELAAGGFKVQVKRTGLAAVGRPTPAPAPATAAGGETLHRVRVGGFTDRAEALEAVRDLEAKGYRPFVARGTQ